MLKLHRLELSGFKSFVDPVTVEFAGGVTGIVGPNGCGKSNLSDAITWVLGEQSAKNMRGETMEDVIFNGSEKRMPLGMGEVSLTFLADPGFAGSDDGRVTLSRRVFRTGESQYRLNGKVVRLKEIKDLLMDTGLGIRAYSVIEQGKIGLILSGKPQERRKLIEEAAGITRYKARKKLAEVKLEEATANLLRLDDIISEIERNLRSLKRQAGAARRFQEKQAELRTLEHAVLSGRWARLAGELEAEQHRLAEGQRSEGAAAAAVHTGEAHLAALRERVEAQAGELAERARRHAELGAVVEGRQQFLAGARRTVAELEARSGAGEAMAERRREEISGHESELSTLSERRGELIREHDAAADLVAADGAKLREVEDETARRESRLEELRQALLASLNELTLLRNRIHREQIESEKGSYRQRHLFDELSSRGEELAETTQALAAANARLAELGVEIAERESALEAARTTLDGLLVREAAATSELGELERERAARSERQRFLAELAESAADRARPLGEKLQALGLDGADLLGHRFRALRGWERALDLYLGELTDAVLLPESADALAIAGRLAGGSSTGVALVGRCSERPTNWPRIEDAAIVAPLGEALGLAAEIAYALPPAFLVASASDAERLAAAHPGVAFLTGAGIWMQGRTLHLPGEEVQPGLLGRTSELADLDEALRRLESGVAAAREEIARLVAARAAAAEVIHRGQEELATLKQEQAAARSRRDELAARHHRVASQEETLQREQDALSDELSRLAALQQDLGSELGRLEGTHAERERGFDTLSSEVDAARRERETQRALGAGRRGQLEVLGERLRSLDQERARVDRARDAAERQLASWREEAAALATRRRELEAAMESAERELQEALELRAGGEETLVLAQGELEGQRQRVRADGESLAAAREIHDAARREVEECRVRMAGLEHDRTHLAGEFLDATGESLPEIPGETPGNLAELETDFARLKQQLEAMGPVNVLAAEEYGSEEERHGFLAAQRSDVVKSVESLRQTIREINQTSSVRFKEAFEQVNAQFARTFTELFRGGEAEMRLMDEEDLLESGIEIVARPPGKRLQNLMLLSGGEKALTAIALLFALFRTKPSPFCILDEVDAPLDDVNTLRFVGMLRELARETQCIVITHNKLTMEVAGTLYGVTMEERGVSKLVAVELEEIQPAEAATA